MENNRLLKFFKVDRVVESVSGFVETRLELFKLEAKDELSKIIAHLIRTSLIAVFIVNAVTFFTVALGIYLGQILDNIVYGFLIIGGAYLLLGILLILLKDKLGLKSGIRQYLKRKIKEIEHE